jgi:hypothetical protein
VIVFTDDDNEWIERIGKTAYEICNDPTRNRIKLNEQHYSFIIESNAAFINKFYRCKRMIQTLSMIY